MLRPPLVLATLALAGFVGFVAGRATADSAAPPAHAAERAPSLAGIRAAVRDELRATMAAAAPARYACASAPAAAIIAAAAPAPPPATAEQDSAGDHAADLVERVRAARRWSAADSAELRAVLGHMNGRDAAETMRTLAAAVNSDEIALEPDLHGIL